MQNNLGFSISVEGVEGAGKDTVISILKKALEDKGHKVEVLADLYSTSIGSRVREMFIMADKPPSDLTTMLLISAARLELINDRILPAIMEGKIVILNRFKDSTIAYQCFAGDPSADDNIDVETLKGKGVYMAQLFSSINAAASINYIPTHTLLLTIDPQTQLMRLNGRGKVDRYDKGSAKWHSLVQSGFDWCVSQDLRGRITTLDNSALSIAELEMAVIDYAYGLPGVKS